jgi:hypothetical protein
MLLMPKDLVKFTLAQSLAKSYAIRVCSVSGIREPRRIRQRR